MKLCDCHIRPYLADPEGYLADADDLKMKLFYIRCTFQCDREEIENASVSCTYRYTNYCRQESVCRVTSF